MSKGFFDVTMGIPTKNEELYLPKTLESIRKQKYPGKIEIIVADAGSSDKTIDIAKEFGCRIIKGGWPSEGRNAIAKVAKYEKLFFIDSDAILPNEDFLTKAMKEIKERELDFAGMPIHYFDGKNIAKNVYLSLVSSVMNFSFWTGQLGKKPPMQTGMIFDKELFLKVGGFRDVHAEEGEIAQRLIVKQDAKYGLLKTPGKILASARRFEKEGYFTYTLNSSFLSIQAYVLNKHSPMERYFKKDKK